MWCLYFQDENSRLIRRTVIRYINLSITMTYRYISSKVYKRFPTLDHLVDAGLLTEKEMVNLKAVNSRSEFLRYVHWIPLSWASSLVVNAYEQVMRLCHHHMLLVISQLKPVPSKFMGHAVCTFVLCICRDT